MDFNRLADDEVELLGILYDTVMESKRQFLIKDLLSMGVTLSQNGKSIRELDYEELKYELVLAAFRGIDVETDANNFF